jgi:hypothetical protein
VLHFFGLSGREARVYLALWQKGAVEARGLVEAARLSRATCYRVLLKLLSRGLAVSSGQWPQKFRAIPFEDVYARVATTFRDELELRERLGALVMNPLSNGHAGASQLVGWKAIQGSGALDWISRSRHQIDVAVRARFLPAPARGELVRVLARFLSQGGRIRLLTDVAPADRRLVIRLHREATLGVGGLEIRGLGPLASHLYVLDSRRVLRFSVLGFPAPSVTAPGLGTSDPVYVRNQVLRFESLWGAGIPASFERRSTRSFGFRSQPGDSRIPSARPEP